MKIQLSDHFDYRKLIRFTLPSVLMMVCNSIYGVVDGLFVSNFAGKAEFTAVNLIMPFLMILGAFGFMFGTGGSALVAKTMGEGDDAKANRQFSLIVYTTIVLGAVMAVLGIVFIKPVAVLLKASPEMAEICARYGIIVLCALPMFMLQYEFSSFAATAEKPKLGLFTTIAAGVMNIVGDAVLVGAFRLGVVGAALATALSQVVGGAVPLVYFAWKKNTSRLHLGRTRFELLTLARASGNGCSELMSNISMSIVSMLYNAQLMNYVGEDGVAAYGVLMYVNMIFLAVFIGYSVGTAPVVSFHYGALNTGELKSLLRRSTVIISVCAVAMLAAGELLAEPLTNVFVGYDEGLKALTLRGFRIFSFTFLFAGFAIFGSGWFTALNNGLISAIISFMRTLLFQVAAVLILPIFLDVDGIWLSVVVAEFTAAALVVIFIFAKRKKYQYL